MIIKMLSKLLRGMFDKALHYNSKYTCRKAQREVTYQLRRQVYCKITHNRFRTNWSSLYFCYLCKLSYAINEVALRQGSEFPSQRHGYLICWNARSLSCDLGENDRLFIG